MSQISSMAILAIYLVGTVRIYLVRNMVHLQQLGTGYFEKTKRQCVHPGTYALAVLNRTEYSEAAM